MGAGPSVLIAGPNASGKSTIVRILTGKPFDPDYSGTVHREHIKTKLGELNLTIIDEPGHKQMIWREDVKAAHAIVYVVDGAIGFTDDDEIRSWRSAGEGLKQVLYHTDLKRKTAVVIAINKSDLETCCTIEEAKSRLGWNEAAEKYMRDVLDEYDKQFRFARISAKNGGDSFHDPFTFIEQNISKNFRSSVCTIV